MVHDSEHRGHFLIAERILFAERVVHGVEVKFQQFNLRGGFVGRRAQNGFQTKDLRKSTAFLCVSLGLLEVLCLVLVEPCV